MSAGNQKTYLLVAVRGSNHKEVFRSTFPQLIQQKKAELKRDPAWKNWTMQFRTEKGYKAVPILTKKSCK